MFRFLIIFAFGFICCSAVAQNPFDIKNRKKDGVKKESKIEKPIPETIEETEPEKIKPVVVPPEKTEISNIPAKPAPAEINTAKEQAYVKSNNPFDVSHTPLTGKTKKNSTLEKAFTPTPTQAPKKERLPKKEETGTTDLSPANTLDKAEKPIPNIRIAEKKKFLERNLPFLLLFISLLILAFVIGFTKKTITNVIRSTYNENFMKMINKQSNNGKSTAFLMLYSLFFINLALLIFLFVKNKTTMHSGVLFSYIFLGLILAYLIRHIFLFVLGSVFRDIKKEASQYSFTIEVFNICAGLALLPLNFFISFGSEKLAQFCLHYFLYLCTCEIGPVFVLIKILTDYL